MSRLTLAYLGPLLLILLVTAGLFWPVVEYSYINLDDPALVQQNADLFKPLSIRTLFKPVAGLYHPLTNLSLWLNARLQGILEFRVYHLTNLLFHLLAVIMIFVWTHRLTGQVVAAFLLTAAFAWHPTHVESIAWISERKDVLSVFFFWASLTAFAYEQFILAMLMAVLSLLSKPFALTLPVVLVWIELWRRDFQTSVLQVIRRYQVSLAVFALFSFTAAALALRSQSTLRKETSTDLLDAIVVLPQQIFFYVHKTIYPVELRLIYERTDLFLATTGSILAGVWIVLTALLCWRNVQFRKDALFGGGFFLLTILPMLKIIPFGDDRLVADRYLYVSQTGLLWPWALWFSRSKKWLAWRSMVAATVLAYWIFLVHERLPDWENSESMWKSVLRISPESKEANENLGRFYMGEERHEIALHYLMRGKVNTWDNLNNQAFLLMRMNRLNEADLKLRQAEELAPGEPTILNLRGNLLMESGQVEMAEKFFLRSLHTPALLQEDQIKAEAQTNLGVAAFRRGDLQGCLNWQAEALKTQPNYVYAIHNRAACQYAAGNFDAAKKDYEFTLRLRPEFAMAHNGLGAVALAQSNLDLAESYFRKALVADPAFKAAQENLQRVLSLKVVQKTVTKSGN